MDSKQLDRIKKAVYLLKAILAEASATETTLSGEAQQKHATFPGSKRQRL